MTRHLMLEILVQAKVAFVDLWVNSLKLIFVVKKEEKWDLFFHFLEIF